ncbi:MAG: thiamine transport system ATP-binding protein, partial [Parvicella sp.]
MLEVKQLTVRRGDLSLAYDLSVEAGTLLTIQGRSGSGKSTLLDAIAGFVSPERGELRWQGNSLLGLAVEERPVSMLFQSNNLFEHLSGLQNIQLGLNKNDSTTKASINAAAMALEISELLNR